MSSEKRVILFTIVTFGSILALEYVMRVTGLTPAPAPPPPAAKVVAEAAKPDAGEKPAAPEVKAATNAEADAKAPPTVAERAPGPAPKFDLADPSELVLGSDRNQGPAGYHLRVALEQNGAGVASVSTGLYEAEIEEGKARRRPLQLLRYDPKAPPSMSLALLPARGAGPEGAETAEAAVAAGVAATPGERALDALPWKLVRHDGKAVRAGSEKDPKTGAVVEYQEATFTIEVEELGLTITKTYRLFQGADAFEMDLTFSSPGKTQPVAYKLLGPHGLPIEGEWYTGTFRDAVFGQVNGGSTKVATLAAYDIVKNQANPERFQALPLKYAGVENQYFTAFVAPKPTPTSDATRWDSESRPQVLHENAEDRQKADIGVEVLTRPLPAGPDAPLTHNYLVFAGPKTVEALEPYGAADLANYRKTSYIPFASDIARLVISPLLSVTYKATVAVARLFGGTRGNYGVAIILLTLLVRLVMFPLGRKQAIAAKKMQDLQPHLKEIQQKYKDDKETQTRETFALYKRHGVNPMGGCLPALIQLPIFVGLWQALNNSVYLRHAGFLWIQNLAAPDMLFRFPAEVPFLGKYFNLLPFLVVALMLVQTKLFSPPATTPEAEMQQKMMKYMMVFMAFMFYKVPSGLGIYFITSSLWQIGERVLLPKAQTAPTDEGKASGGDAGGGSGGRGGGGTPAAPAKPPGRLAKFFEKVLDEASKDPTYRKVVEERDKDKDKDKDRGGPDGDRGKPRARPGRRR